MASADAVEIGGIYYELSSDGTNTATVISSPNKYTGDVVIPASVTYNEVTYSVTTIGAEAFRDCSITSVTIPNSITSIDMWAFWGCDRLTAVHISSLEAWCKISINDGGATFTNPLEFAHHLYLNGEEIKDLVIPNSVTSILYSTFRGGYFTSVTIPNSVTSIGNRAFSECRYLISATIPNSVISIEDGAFAECDCLISVNLPEKLTYIGIGAFERCSSIPSMTIPSGVTTIPECLFSQCSSLTSVTIPNSVTSIGDCAFQWCSSLTTVTIPNSVTYIGESIFFNCSNLTSVTIPNGVPSIGRTTFASCFNLSSVTIPNSVTSIGNQAFWDCQSLRSITIPNSVTSISDQAFYGCSGLITVEIPNNLTMIKSETFKNCSSLESLIIPASVEYIFQEAFANCSNLKNVKSLATIPPIIYNNTFTIDQMSNATLYVPTGTIDKYKAATGWNDFPFIVDGTGGGNEETGDTDVDEIKITSAGQTTWCSAYDLDFTNVDGLKAYIASGYHRTKGTIWLTRVKEVPAGEGILLIGDAGDYKVPRVATTAYYANLMVGTVEAITINETDGEYTNYYLSNGASGIGFYKVNGSIDLKANRAYLPLLKNTVSSTRGFIDIEFDDDSDGTTGISEAKQRVGEQDVYYNLQGQRVDNPSKGLYIKNGRKVLIK